MFTVITKSFGIVLVDYFLVIWPAIAYLRFFSLDFGYMMYFQTLTIDNINPKTGQPFGQEFMQNGILDLWCLYILLS